MLSVAEALQLDALKHCRIVGGRQGLGRLIKSVNQMDAPDFVNWTESGQFIVTTGYFIRNDANEQRQLIIDLSERQCAGLGIKVKRFFQAIPQQMIDMADELGLPLVEIPAEYNISKVMNELMKEIVSQQARTIERSHCIHDRFTEIALKGGGLHAVAELLGTFVNTSVSIADSAWNTMTVYEHPGFTVAACDLQRFETAISSALIQECLSGHGKFITETVADGNIQRVIYPVKTDNKLYGFITVWRNGKKSSDSSDDIDTVAVEHAGTVMVLEILRHTAHTELARNYRNDFFADYLSGQIKDRELLARRGAAYGVNMKANYLCIVMDIDNFTKIYLQDLSASDAKAQNLKAKMLVFVEQAIRAKGLRAITHSQSDQCVILLQTDMRDEEIRETVKELVVAIRELLRKNFDNLTVTVGVGVVRPALQVPESYSAAMEAITLGRRRQKEQGLFLFGDFYIEHLLSTLDPHRAEALYADTIAKLEKFDKENGAELVKTLETFLRCKYNLTEAAKSIFIHRNTLTYRLEKIQELLKVDLNDYNSLLKLQLAIKLKDIMQ